MRQDISTRYCIASIVSIHTASYQYILTSFSYLIQILVEFIDQKASWLPWKCQMLAPAHLHSQKTQRNNLLLSFSSLRERVSFDKK